MNELSDSRSAKVTTVKQEDFKQDSKVAKAVSYMFRMAGKAFAVSAVISRKIMRRLYQTQNQKVSNIWEQNGGELARVNYPLKNDSVVFDVGGYHGDFASAIYGRYSCRIYVFEPVSAFCEMIRQRFFGNPNIKVFNFGLGEKSEAVSIVLDNDGSSVFKKSVGIRREQIQIVSITEFMEREKIFEIDLLKLNVEGAEYGILNNILEADKHYILGIRNIQVQFHDISSDSVIQKRRIQEKLSETHHLTYEYEFVWENWKVNEQ